MSDELVFNSKMDLWLLIVLLAAVSACLWGIAWIWDADSAVLWPLAALLAIGCLLPLWMIVSLKYFLTDERLRVRCGPFHWRIAIKDITAVTATNSARTGPAMSLDRLLIEHGNDSRVMIAPEPRGEFLRQLEHRRRQAG